MGERVGAAESALRGAEAGQEASVAEAIDAAQARVAQVFEHHNVLKSQFSAERRAAQESLDAIAREQGRVSNDLQAVIRRIGDGSEGASAPLHGNAYVPRRVNGKASGAEIQLAQRPPRVGDLDVETGEIYTAERVAQERAEIAKMRAETTGSEATNAEAQRLSALHDHLAAARAHAEEHLASVDQAIKATDDLAYRETQQASSRAAAEIERAQASVASNISTTSQAHQKAQLALDAARENVKRVETETAGFVEEARGKGEVAVAQAEKRGAARIASAEADAAKALEEFKASAAKERAGLAKTHEAQAKALPGPNLATDVDALAEGFGKYQAARSKGGAPLISNGGLWGAGMSVVHGNPMGALGALGVSFAAGRARNVSNLTTARVLRGISQTLTSLDAAVRDGAQAILTGSKVARSVANMSRGEKEPSFEDLSQSIIDAQANPLELEHRVRESVGDLAGHAPGTYQEILATTQRAHAYLFSILPEPQRDPYSLTPHLDRGQVNETARYDFMSSARSIDDPLSLFEDVHSGDITQAQVDAVAFVYPQLFDRMRNEVKRQSMYLTTPVDYMREVHVGVLLGQVTNQVLEPDFQKLLRDSYAEKNKKAESQNVGSGGGQASKSAENMKSGSESIEGGM
jgi:hypothetical protein